MKRLVESAVGDLGTVAQRLNEQADRDEEAQNIEETKKFVASTPDWYPSQKNKIELMNYIEGNTLAMTAKNFQIAWDEMKKNGVAEFAPPATGEEEELELVPAGGGGQRQPAGDGTRPRYAAFSTGVRAEEISGARPNPKPYVLTWDIVDSLSSKEKERRLRSDPQWVKAMDALPPR